MGEFYMNLIDMHCDTISLIHTNSKGHSFQKDGTTNSSYENVIEEKMNLKKNDLHVDLEKLRLANAKAQFFALFVEYDYLKKSKIILKPEVWFTPEIPVPFGPKGFDGLPGLILEATNNGKTFIYASKIQFNPENINEILTEPKGGNDIAKDDYLKILAEKINE